MKCQQRARKKSAAFSRVYMAEGNLEALLSIYDAEAVFLNQSGELKKGREGLREVLAPLAAAKTNFDFRIIQIIRVW